MERGSEIRRLYRLSVAELIAKSKGKLKVFPDLAKLYRFLAESMVAEFEKAAGATKAFIMPVGPTEPYQIMADIINRKKISLNSCWFFFMDEYCDDKGKRVTRQYPISFRRQVDALFFAKIGRGLGGPRQQVIFPDNSNLRDIPAMIKDLGGIEVCYGGIGIHGHLAFNEPAPGIKNTDPRVVEINAYTRTVDAVRHGLGGNLVNFPRKAVTLGMKQVLGARKLLLMTRNEHAGMDWANTVLRIAVLGKPGDDYPVTHIRNHPDYIIATDKGTASAPDIVL